MAHKVISDEELLLLLSPICDNQETNLAEKPKLTMKLLFELIKKLKEENLILSNRITEYELKLDMLLQNKAEVASTTEAAELVEPLSKQNEIDCVLPIVTLAPRSVRHPSQRKKPMWLLFIRSVTRFFFRRRKVFIHTHRNGI
ncbi:hypothetical protein [Paenibacillus aceris]|uniref:Uncharacterized protein n=1 Tax=Paenibacillus aceris TaxID=869555 RepID=A0ABS4I1V7_9BACL|nr:hypothetical protein [Paenibacillus aceris]MBP1964541.1 hypothetical protein [Paenibacillus aceris]